MSTGWCAAVLSVNVGATPAPQRRLGGRPPELVTSDGCEAYDGEADGFVALLALYTHDGVIAGATYVLSEGLTHPLWWRYADNLVYLCQSVPEAHQVLKEARHRLGEARLSLKGSDGPPVDLKEEKAKLLGLSLSLHKGQDVTLPLSADALDDLRQHLVEAHEATTPSAAASMAVRGWVNAHGPACGTLTTGDILADVLKAAADCGFREVFSLETLKQLAGGAWKAWRACLNTAERRRFATAAPTDA
jgi:hypothetical protein